MSWSTLFFLVQTVSSNISQHAACYRHYSISSSTNRGMGIRRMHCSAAEQVRVVMGVGDHRIKHDVLVSW